MPLMHATASVSLVLPIRQRRLHAGQWHLWSNTSPFGWTSWTMDSTHRQRLHVVAPVDWNSLPTHPRSTSICRGQFTDRLKTWFVWINCPEKFNSSLCPSVVFTYHKLLAKFIYNNFRGGYLSFQVRRKFLLAPRHVLNKLHKAHRLSSCNRAIPLKAIDSRISVLASLTLI